MHNDPKGQAFKTGRIGLDKAILTFSVSEFSLLSFCALKMLKQKQVVGGSVY